MHLLRFALLRLALLCFALLCFAFLLLCFCFASLSFALICFTSLRFALLCLPCFASALLLLRFAFLCFALFRFASRSLCFRCFALRRKSFFGTEGWQRRATDRYVLSSTQKHMHSAVLPVHCHDCILCLISLCNRSVHTAGSGYVHLERHLFLIKTETLPSGTRRLLSLLRNGRERFTALQLSREIK